MHKRNEIPLTIVADIDGKEESEDDTAEGGEEPKSKEGDEEPKSKTPSGQLAYFVGRNVGNAILESYAHIKE